MIGYLCSLIEEKTAGWFNVTRETLTPSLAPQRRFNHTLVLEMCAQNIPAWLSVCCIKLSDVLLDNVYVALE
jgi:hypothetical protein